MDNSLPCPLLPTLAPASLPDGGANKSNLPPSCWSREESQVLQGTVSSLPPLSHSSGAGESMESPQ